MAYKPKNILHKNKKVLKNKTFILSPVPITENDRYIEIFPNTPLTHVAQEYYGNPNM